MLEEVGAQCDQKHWLAEEICNLIGENSYGVRDNLLTSACKVLPDSILTEMIDRFWQQAEQLDVGHADSQSWNKPSRKCWAAAIELAAGMQTGQ